MASHAVKAPGSAEGKPGLGTGPGETEELGNAALEPADSRITSEELAAALLGGAGGLGGSTDGEEGEDDGFEWEDAGLVLDYDGSTNPGASKSQEPAQPQRRNLWSRTHGYKFGRKLGDWSGGGGSRGGDGAATEVSPAIDPLEAAVLGAAAEEGDGVPAETLQEQRTLQHGILNSLEVPQPDSAGPVGRAEASGTAQPNAADAAEMPTARSPSAGPSPATPPEAGGGVPDAPEIRAADSSGAKAPDDSEMEWEPALPQMHAADTLPTPPVRVQVPATEAPDATEGAPGPPSALSRPPGSLGTCQASPPSEPVAPEPARLGGGLKMSMPKWGGGARGKAQRVPGKPAPARPQVGRQQSDTMIPAVSIPRMCCTMPVCVRSCFKLALCVHLSWHGDLETYTDAVDAWNAASCVPV